MKAQLQDLCNTQKLGLYEDLSTFNNFYPDHYSRDIESHAKYEIPEMSEALSLSSCVILHLARQDQPHTDVLNLLNRENFLTLTYIQRLTMNNITELL